MSTTPNNPGRNSWETFYGFIENSKDALLLFQACRLNLLPRASRRYTESERNHIRSGTVVVYDEAQSGIKRWTDGKIWSPSRIMGNFLIYRELKDKIPPSQAKHYEQPKADCHTTLSIQPPLANEEPAGAYDHDANHGPPAGPTNSARYSSQGPYNQPHPQQLNRMGAEMARYNHGPLGLGGETPGEEALSDPNAIHPLDATDSRLVSPVGQKPLPKHPNSHLYIGTKGIFFIKNSGLVKKTMSLNVDGTTFHLVCYYLENTPDGHPTDMQTPRDVFEVRDLNFTPDILNNQHFRRSVQCVQDDDVVVDLLETTEETQKTGAYSTTRVTYPTLTNGAHADMVTPLLQNAHYHTHPSHHPSYTLAQPYPPPIAPGLHLPFQPTGLWNSVYPAHHSVANYPQPDQLPSPVSPLGTLFPHHGMEPAYRDHTMAIPAAQQGMVLPHPHATWMSARANAAATAVSASASTTLLATHDGGSVMRYTPSIPLKYDTLAGMVNANAEQNGVGGMDHRHRHDILHLNQDEDRHALAAGESNGPNWALLSDSSSYLSVPTGSDQETKHPPGTLNDDAYHIDPSSAHLYPMMADGTVPSGSGSSSLHDQGHGHGHSHSYPHSSSFPLWAQAAHPFANDPVARATALGNYNDYTTFSTGGDAADSMATFHHLLSPSIDSSGGKGGGAGTGGGGGVEGGGASLAYSVPPRDSRFPDEGQRGFHDAIYNPTGGVVGLESAATEPLRDDLESLVNYPAYDPTGDPSPVPVLVSGSESTPTSTMLKYEAGERGSLAWLSAPPPDYSEMMVPSAYQQYSTDRLASLLPMSGPAMDDGISATVVPATVPPAHHQDSYTFENRRSPSTNPGLPHYLAVTASQQDLPENAILSTFNSFSTVATEPRESMPYKRSRSIEPSPPEQGPAKRHQESLAS
ncbi:Global transcription regulator sge1 [Dimargaris cristalligena]|nr:Global transcription regulator sge1 [Dimargaris cristalligena]